MGRSSDEWAAGVAYEDFMGRWSRLLAPRFVSWLSVRPTANRLDVGCGTGALSDAICVGANPASVIACDPSEPFIEYARQRQVDPRVSFVVAGLGQLPLRLGGFDSVTSLLALNFFPRPEAAIDEMRRITGADGLVSACVWDYAGRQTSGRTETSGTRRGRAIVRAGQARAGSPPSLVARDRRQSAATPSWL